MRAGPRERPQSLTAAPDGQTLEQIIGELQSVWGVPQYPQEYRITIKVADDKNGRPDQDVATEETTPAVDLNAPGDGGGGRGRREGPKREKAPAAPALGLRGSEAAGASPRRRRRRRRRRSGPGGGQAGS